MKLEYFDLLSPNPVYLHEVGGILSPTLKSIASIGIHTYQYYLTVLSMDLHTYFTITGQNEQTVLLSDNEQAHRNIFDLLTTDKRFVSLLQEALNFFIQEDVTYSVENNAFLVRKNSAVTGAITSERFPQVCDIICQRNCIQSNYEEKTEIVKSKKALEIMKKLQKGRTLKD